MTTLVAGFGNIFLSDDGFGCAAVRMLAGVDLGPSVRLRDFGTGGVHLALEMLAGYDAVVILDAIARDEPAGTLFVVDCSDECTIAQAPPDAHAMNVSAVFSTYAAMRDQMNVKHKPKVFVVGCVPQNLNEGMELSEPVRAALPACLDLVHKLTRQSVSSGAET